MSRRRGRQRPRTYTCRDPPCIHIVVDERKNLVKAFFDDGEILTPISISALQRACEDLSEALSQGLREAEADEIDYLARKYLNAKPVEDEEEIVEE